MTGIGLLTTPAGAHQMLGSEENTIKLVKNTATRMIKDEWMWSYSKHTCSSWPQQLNQCKRLFALPMDSGIFSAYGEHSRAELLMVC